MFSFLLRAAFWITVLAFLLPSAGNLANTQSSQPGSGYTNTALTGTEPAGQAQANSDMDAGEALNLAAKSAEDVLGFCDRNPDVCSKSGAVVQHVIDQTAYYGSRLFLWLTDKAKETAQSDETRAAAQPDPRDEGLQHQAPAFAVPAARPQPQMTGA